MWQRLRKLRDRVSGIAALVQFRRTREGYVPSTGRLKAKVPWSWLGVTSSDLQTLQSAVVSAERLTAVFEVPGWSEILEAKAYYQASADSRTKNPDLSEADRFRAACEWAALEGFFKELYRRAHNGPKASEKLSRMAKSMR